MFTLRFDTDNAVFEESFASECARILREVADKLEEGDDNGAIRDINGNSIGKWSY